MTVSAPCWCLVTCTSGQLGSSMTAPALAASAPLRKVGPRFTVTEANLSIQSVINHSLMMDVLYLASSR